MPGPPFVFGAMLVILAILVAAFIPENSTKFDPHEYQGTISDLTPGQKYTFQIQAQTKIGYGPPLRKEQKMPILAPPVPARSVKLIIALQS